MVPRRRLPPTKEGRHPLPDSRPKTQIPQDRAASAARDPRGSGAIAESKSESVPVPQSAAMMRQTSKPYINRAAPLPYRNEADAKEDLETTITAVNRGHQPSNSDVKDGPIQQLPEAGDSSRPGQARIFNGREYSSREWEAAEILLSIFNSISVNDQPPPVKIFNGGECSSPECEAAEILVSMSKSIRVNTQPPPASYETQPKRKRDEDEENEGKKAKQENKKQHKCNHCDMWFSRYEHVVRHAKNLHEPVREKFLCDVCGKKFSRKDNLSQHRKSVHPGAGPAPVPKSVFATVDENGNETGTAEGAENVESRAQSDCEKVGHSDSPSGHMPKRGRSTSTTSGSSSPQTTTETGSKFTPINKPC